MSAWNRIERTASKRWRGSFRQILAAVIYNLSCFTHGCSTGWVSGVLGSEALAGGAWLAALPCLVALPAAPFFAVLADSKGRKAGALCIAISFILSWSLAACSGARGVWAARAAAGAGGAGALALAPLYCAEVAPRTRGLAAMPTLACSCGILFAYSAGGVLSAHALSLSMAVPPAVLLVSLIWLPETPSFLIRVGKIQEAARVMCWFDGSDFREDLTDVIEQQEVRLRRSEWAGRAPLPRAASDTFQPMLTRSSGLDECAEKSHSTTCRELFCGRGGVRALVSCAALLLVAAGSGAGALLSFAAAVLRHSGRQLPALNHTSYNYTIYNGTAPRSMIEMSDAGSILCGAALVLGAVVATITVDKLGRKMLLIWSCSGIACCLAILGVYCDPRLKIYAWYSHRIWQYRQKALDSALPDPTISEYPYNLTNIDLISPSDVGNFAKILEDSNQTEMEIKPASMSWNKTNAGEASIWTVTLLLSAVMFLYNVGLGSVPFVLISELFSLKVRTLASSLLISWMWLSSFLVFRYFGKVADSLGLHGVYYICASVTLAGSIFTFLLIPETKGRSWDRIEEDLKGPWLLCLRRSRKDDDSVS